MGGEENEVEHQIFSEMDELCCNESGLEEWKETARWLKFEEDVEEGGNRWSKPHVATLSLYSLFELRSCVLNGTVLLDLNATTMSQIAGKLNYYAFSLDFDWLLGHCNCIHCNKIMNQTRQENSLFMYIYCIYQYCTVLGLGGFA